MSLRDRLLYHKPQLHPTTSLHNPTIDTLHAGSDSRGSILTELEPPPNDFRALAIELSKISPPETLVIALENISREQDDHSNDGNAPSHLRQFWSTETDRIQVRRITTGELKQ
jgi:hypothetical protein